MKKRIIKKDENFDENMENIEDIDFDEEDIEDELDDDYKFDNYSNYDIEYTNGYSDEDEEEYEDEDEDIEEQDDEKRTVKNLKVNKEVIGAIIGGGLGIVLIGCLYKTVTKFIEDPSVILPSGNATTEAPATTEEKYKDLLSIEDLKDSDAVKAAQEANKKAEEEKKKEEKKKEEKKKEKAKESTTEAKSETVNTNTANNSTTNNVSTNTNKNTNTNTTSNEKSSNGPAMIKDDEKSDKIPKWMLEEEEQHDYYENHSFEDEDIPVVEQDTPVGGAIESSNDIQTYYNALADAIINGYEKSAVENMSREYVKKSK